MNEENGLVSTPVHERSVTIRSYDLGSHKILMEGRLVDNRFRPGSRDDYFIGSKIIHDLTVRLVIQGPDLVICEASGAMNRHPHEECPETLPGFSELINMKIRPGFTEKLKSMLGGAQGCAHLNTLVINLVQASLQGYFSAYSRFHAQDDSLDATIRRLVDTCHVWRSDGPLAKSIKR